MKYLNSTSLTQFNASKVAFGRHETFGLRYGWLPKGFQAFIENPDIFKDDEATVRLGVGKNMVSSIRYWLQASRMIERTNDGLFATRLGVDLLSEDGWDPYLEDEATIWLIHWLTATNAELATATYWLFNRFHKPEFTTLEVTSALLDFAKEKITAKTSETTIKNDIALTLRMYVQSKGNTRTPLEEALDSPLSLLNLVSRLPGNKMYQSKSEVHERLPLGIFGFAVTEIFNIHESNMIPIEDLMYSDDGIPALGSVFRLTENALITKLEKLVSYIPGLFELRETAGIHQLYKLEDVQPKQYLKKHYGRRTKRAAA